MTKIKSILKQKDTVLKQALCDEYKLNYSQIAKFIGYSTVYCGSVLRGYNPMTKRFMQRALILLGMLEQAEIQDVISNFSEYDYCMEKVKEFEAVSNAD